MSGEPKQADWIKKFHGSSWKDHGLSIRHVYEHIERLGANKPYLLEEFHAFGHASSSAHGALSGTAFANTTHIGNMDKRHALDLDARGALG